MEDTFARSDDWRVLQRFEQRNSSNEVAQQDDAYTAPDVQDNIDVPNIFENHHVNDAGEKIACRAVDIQELIKKKTTFEDIEDEEEDEDIALVAMENPEEEENNEKEVCPLELKEKLETLSKKKLTSLMIKMIDSYSSMSDGKEQLLSALTSLKFEYIELEIHKGGLEKENSSLQNQVTQLGTQISSLKSEVLTLSKGNPSKQAMTSEV